MNTLSWLLYVADVAGNLNSLFFITAGILIGVAVLWGIIGTFMAMEPADSKDWKVWRGVGFKVLLPVFFISWILGSVVPSKETVYAIAASEMGETALNTETGNKAVKALNKWLDKQIGEEGTEGK